MKLREKAKLRKFLRLKDLFQLYHDILSKLPNYILYSKEFSTLLNSILDQISLQSLNKKGIVDAKKDIRKKLSILVEDTANRLNTYAMITNNVNLQSQTKITEGALRRMSEMKLYGVGRAIHEQGQANLSALSSYGVTAASLSSLDASIESFLSFIPKPEEGILDTKQNTRKIADLLKDEDACVKKIEILIRLIKYSYPEVYREFMDAKHEKIKGRQRLSAKIRAYDEISKLGIAFCVFRLTRILDEQNQPVGQQVPIIQKTYKQGGGYIKSLPRGTYKVEVCCTGYETQWVQAVIDGNKLVKIEVGMRGI